ncbi:endonuclease dU [Methanoregula sp.]|uniref:endonuclease dU n=1 Tax=Methanoregula sp. TaxID=2052170 RepID=UPI003FD7529E
MHIPKKGLRALGIAESYSGREHSTLAGIVMRKDLIIDGCAFSRVAVGGMDATEGVLAIVQTLDRRDINVIFLSGCVIAFFNIIDPRQIHECTGLPVICVTYEESAGLDGDICHHFPGDTARLDAYRRLGDRVPHILPDRQTVYLRSWGFDPADAGRLCTAFTHEGKIPEPLRVARLSARAAHDFAR